MIRLHVLSKLLVDSDFCSDLVDWADLVTLDLSTFDTPGGKEKLATQLSEAVNRIGQLSPGRRRASRNRNLRHSNDRRRPSSWTGQY